jgi:hypothetical protein
MESHTLSGHARFDGPTASPADRRKAYRELFRTARDADFADALRAATNGGWALGDARLKPKRQERLRPCQLRRSAPGGAGAALSRMSSAIARATSVPASVSADAVAAGLATRPSTSANDRRAGTVRQPPAEGVSPAACSP